MKLLKIELFCLGLIMIIGLTAQIRVYFGWYNFTEVKATLMDEQWKGSPYIVKEVNFKNRCFEKGDVVNLPSAWDAETILNDYPYFLTTLNIDDKTYHSNGNLVELCLDIKEEKIDTVQNGWFSYDMILYYKIEVKWDPMLLPTFQSTDDYFVEYTSKVSASGLGSEAYKKQQIREFVLRRTLDVIVEYDQSSISQMHSFMQESL